MMVEDCGRFLYKFEGVRRCFQDFGCFWNDCEQGSLKYPILGQNKLVYRIYTKYNNRNDMESTCSSARDMCIKEAGVRG